MILTERDQQWITLLGRWYCLSVDHIIRATNPEEVWASSVQASDAFVGEVHRKGANAIRQRLWKLAGITENPNAGIGPFISNVSAGPSSTAWFATRYGISGACLPWDFRPSINYNFIQHAWMAADIGMQFERAGFTAYSEREFRSGKDWHGQDIDQSFRSVHTAPSGTQTGKVPDVVVVAPGGVGFLAVEVEKLRARSLGDYTEKLRAYDDNPSVKGVWYICDNVATAGRVRKAAEQVFRDRPYNLKVKVVPPLNGAYLIPGLSTDERLTTSLSTLGPLPWTDTTSSRSMP